MNKLKKINNLKVIVEKERKKGRKVVFANGCFDILHVGHIRYLKEAKELGDMLIVAINSDSSAKKLKGNGRPVTERAEIVAAIEYVDYVTIFNEPDVSSLLLTLKPDIHAKGTDYTENSVPEVDTVRAYGGSVAITGDKKERSSTNLISNIKSQISKLRNEF